MESLIACALPFDSIVTRHMLPRPGRTRVYQKAEINLLLARPPLLRAIGFEFGR